MDELAALTAREEEVAREWQWLVEALVEVASQRQNAFRVLQQQALNAGKRRAALQARLAEASLAPLAR